ncbi:MAG TPA: hypothetical protein VK783_09945 [Bacteroidia bacterium]|jgi:hypothetical protein|nr:hypothetical protein [Bacteroidia bacterium]
MKYFSSVLLLANCCILVACKNKPAIIGVQPPLNTKTAMSLLDGSWFDKNSENAEFYIVDDSLQFIDDLKREKYVVNADTFILFTKNPFEKMIILKLTRDSLIEEGVVTHEIDRYWKAK